MKIGIIDTGTVVSAWHAGGGRKCHTIVFG